MAAARRAAVLSALVLVAHAWLCTATLEGAFRGCFCELCVVLPLFVFLTALCVCRVADAARATILERGTLTGFTCWWHARHHSWIWIFQCQHHGTCKHGMIGFTDVLACAGIPVVIDDLACRDPGVHRRRRV